jgi:hypothetical protein
LQRRLLPDVPHQFDALHEQLLRERKVSRAPARKLLQDVKPRPTIGACFDSVIQHLKTKNEQGAHHTA